MPWNHIFIGRSTQGIFLFGGTIAWELVLLLSTGMLVVDLTTQKWLILLIMGTGIWRWSMLAPQHVAFILALQLQIQEGIADKVVWKPNFDGTFSFAFAWNMTREQRVNTSINRIPWNKNIPFKCFFFTLESSKR